jgi:hypothetical protein
MPEESFALFHSHPFLPFPFSSDFLLGYERAPLTDGAFACEFPCASFSPYPRAVSAPSPRKFLLLPLLGAATFLFWKWGSPGQPAPHPAPATSAAHETASGYGEAKETKCCEKPPSKSSLLQSPASQPSP